MSGRAVYSALVVAGAILSIASGYVVSVDEWYEAELGRLARPTATVAPSEMEPPRTLGALGSEAGMLGGLPAARDAAWLAGGEACGQFVGLPRPGIY